MIAVRNNGTKTIPNVAVTICNVTCAYPAPKGQGTDAAAFSEDLDQANLANPSRPIWIVDQPPGPCRFVCQPGGPGGAVTAYSNTWALGQLAAGRDREVPLGRYRRQPGGTSSPGRSRPG